MSEDQVFEDVEVEAEEQDSKQTADQATEQAEEQDERKARHDERVANWAARFAALVAKGEEVMAALEAKANAADESFTAKSAAADAQVADFAADMQERVEQVVSQITADLDVFAQAVEQAAAEGETAEEASATEDAPAEDVSFEDVPGAEDVAEDVPTGAPCFTAGAAAFRERMRVDAVSDLMLTDPEFVERFANFAFDDVVADVALDDRTRFMCWLATLLGCQGIDEFKALLPAALNMGVEPVAIKEIVYQASAYLGIGRVYPFLKATNEGLMAAGVELPLPSQAHTLPTQQSRYEGGETAQMAAIGGHMAGYKDKGNPGYPWINQWLVKNCFGDWYTRGGLTIPEREMVTFCLIAAQGGCEAQLRGHTAANVQCGNDREFLIKVVSNNVPFIGYPRSLNALAVIEEVTGTKE